VPTKAAVKMHTLLDLRGAIPSFLHISDGRSRSRSAVGGYAVSVKAEPIEEHKESGIILDLTRCAAPPE
jgi:hypothetical protein